MNTLLKYSVSLLILLFGCNPSGQEESPPVNDEIDGTMVASSPSGSPLSPAMERAYNFWPTKDDRENELYTNFKYSYISGIGKDPLVSRRDPSKIIRHNGKYYVWYTRRKTKVGPAGMDKGSDEIPSVDWDLADIYYATSEDGFSWTEQGVAVPRAPKGQYGDRSATTTDILVFKGKYYLFYQTFTGLFSSKTGDHCDVSMAWADSPDGPWTRSSGPILPLGSTEEWDGGAIHDPYPLVYKGKIWIFYKGQPSKLAGGADWLVRAQGVAIADDPMGPYVKPDINPVLNSGHETCLFPWKEGIAAIVSIDGPEKNTIQYAEDGLNFNMMAAVTVPPIAPGPYVADAFLDGGDGKGITWGLSHVNLSIIDPSNYRRIVEQQSFLIRFDCDLHRDFDLPYFKNPRDQVGRFSEETFFQAKMVLEPDAKKEVLSRMGSLH